MANNVFANGREISCKKADGKSICCFPDVCFTPPDKVPPTPPGVPIPYPNTGMAKDTTSGSKKVKISGQEILLKNKSYFKTSVGDEAGCATKKGVITSKTKGKVYFTAWSMDVRVEGENVVRHMDLTTHNHGSGPNTAPWTYADRMASGVATGACDEEAKKAKDECGDLDKKAECPPEGQDLVDARKTGSGKSSAEKKKLERKLGGAVQKNPCQKALRCFLTPYSPNKCCPGQTPDHLIEAKAFLKPGEKRNKDAKKNPGWSGYDPNAAPCLCAEGGAANLSTHGVLSTKRKAQVLAHGKGKPMSLDKAADIGANTAAHTFKGCSAACIKAQLMAYHKGVQDDPNATVKPPAHGMGASSKAKRGVLSRAQSAAGG
ncbi:MAG: DUF4150 domain-containing protein [Rhodothermia bacterium]|nr:DUF4150 domain-containing protein [Rhodothermia bacterium]